MDIQHDAMVTDGHGHEIAYEPIPMREVAPEVPYEAPQAASYETSQTVPYETSQAVPYETSQAAPYETPQTVPYETSRAAPYETPQAVPYETPQAVPYETPQAVPYENLQAVPYENLQAAPQEEDHPVHIIHDVHEVPEAQKHMDHTIDRAMDYTMDGDDSMNSTITASTITPLSEMPPSIHNNGYTSEPHRPQTSYSDTTFSHNNYSHGNQEGGYSSRFNTPSDADTPPRQSYYGGKETQMGQSHSRPNSMLGHRPHSEGNTRSAAYQEHNHRSTQSQQEPASKSASVVIKVGMVGDAQIGKTSLMVKYVEGSWDEDYIQTLGGSTPSCIPYVHCTNLGRCQLHGKDHLHQEHRNYLLYMGSGGSARVRQHAAVGMQRCCRDIVHVRLDKEEHPELYQGVVSPRPRI
jgi:hypothetical protein